MPRYLIYSEGQFGTPASKTGNSVIRYSRRHVAAVLDSRLAGKTRAGRPRLRRRHPGRRHHRRRHRARRRLAARRHRDRRRRTAGTGCAPQSNARSTAGWTSGTACTRSSPTTRSSARSRDSVASTCTTSAGRPTICRSARAACATSTQTVVLAVGSDANIGKMTVMLQLRDAHDASAACARLRADRADRHLHRGLGDLCRCGRRRLHRRRGRGGHARSGEGCTTSCWSKARDRFFIRATRACRSACCTAVCRTRSSRVISRRGRPSATTHWLPIPPLDDVIALHEAIAHPLRPAQDDRRVAEHGRA